MLNFFLEHKNTSGHKKLTKSNNVYFVSGIIFLLTILFIYKLTFISLIFTSMYFLGLFSDLNKLNSPKIRFLIQVAIVLLAVIFYDINIYSTKIALIDELLKFELFQIFFSCFCLMILINGSNFIDGVNLNLTGYYLLILLTILFLSSNTSFLIDLDITYLLIFVFSIIYALNITGRFISGDSGAYTYGFFFGIYLIQFSNDNQLISPMFIVLLLWYPAFENLFSIMRKKKLNISPLNPDFKHLHQLIFNKLNKNFNKNKNVCNNLTGLILNLYNFFIFFIGVKYIYDSQILSLLILFNIIIYLKVYFTLLKKDFI